MTNTIYSQELVESNQFIGELKANPAINKIAEKHQLNFQQAQITHYKEIGGSSVVIPLLDGENSFVVAYYDEKFNLKDIKLMGIKLEGNDLELSFADAEETFKTISTIKDGKFVKTAVEGEAVIEQGLVDCVERGFNSLPDWLQWSCKIACTAFWTPAGAAACAGCLAGLGIKC
ncbi:MULTISPECIES: hypothetical protein [Bacillus cereus group]|uniref:hypothetical protein n=1 Tax=Bacillus cereus group TaxID=86661 RepID=UPI00016B6A06|nr:MULTISPECIES: hypothetical protein [Bacillus cereus group]EDZ48797.1 hypothetical protein BCAH1134_C0015 [Bacillus cereus AH1134]EKS8379143.1 hypothetical protein [Bacillus cereus]EKS8385325.1 hypothetical protein [Bacillus cereus]EMA7399811.1 hypothetical protein [Bacillus cereus]MBG9468838.1 hypothetical protein [Bacillus thuringiensis]